MRDLLTDLDGGDDPVKRVRNAMKTPLPKRFYQQATVGQSGGGFAVLLDSKPARTPGRAALTLPTGAAAQLVADEFSAQVDVIDPVSMPVLRLVNSAIDGVSTDPRAVHEDIARFSSSDLLCYRAGSPASLAARQGEAWDPVIGWARKSLGARFILAEGVMPVPQPREALAAFDTALARFADPLSLAAIHSMTTLTGSALLALAVAMGELMVEQAWSAAHVDEDFNVSLWGEDAEASARRAFRRTEMMAAAALLAALS
ncbi:MAG: ATPase [Phyllobacteriaceae bacterium]|nr:ATPase [Phyllobacteriaceae bacterium]